LAIYSNTVNKESVTRKLVPDIGIRIWTLSALRIRYNASATIWWHQNISFRSQPHLTDVILHL